MKTNEQKIGQIYVRVFRDLQDVIDLLQSENVTLENQLDAARAQIVNIRGYDAKPATNLCIHKNWNVVEHTRGIVKCRDCGFTGMREHFPSMSGLVRESVHPAESEYHEHKWTPIGHGRIECTFCHAIQMPHGCAPDEA